MKVTRIETIPVNVPINPDRAIVGARGGHLESPFLIVRVHTDEGLTGIGEVSSTPGWSGEDQLTAAHHIRAYIEPALLGKDPREVQRLDTAMRSVVAFNPFTRAGVEMALWDILGKAAGLPLYRLWGGPVRAQVRTKFSVSGLAPERAAEIAAWAVTQGFTAMKVKVGRELATDMTRVSAVRAAVGPDVRLGVDANGGWSASTAREAAARLSQLDVAFLEQPVAPERIEELARVRAHSSIPIIADESVWDRHDAMAVIRAEAADALSVYVGKGGGLGEARAVIGLAEAAGVACTIGSNLELGPATAAMIHLGLASPGIADESYPCDILSVFFYEDMLLQEPLPITAGSALPIDRPGLGVELDEQKLDRYRVK